MRVLDPTGAEVSGSISRVTDEELVASAQSGDAEAFDQLVVRHQAAAYRAALAALRNTHDAEEVAQEAFVRAWRNVRRFRGEASFRTWLLTIVWRRAMSRRRRVFAWWGQRAPVDALRSAAAPSESPEQAAATREFRRHIAAAIEALSPRLRDALLLTRSGEYDYAEIAAMLQIPHGTLKWRVSEARRKVRARLAELGYVDARGT